MSEICHIFFIDVSLKSLCLNFSILILFSFISESNSSFGQEFEGCCGPSKKSKLICSENFCSIISGKKGLLIVSSGKLLQFATSRCTDAQIFAARHINELEPAKDTTFVRLDSAQRGIGSGSCGPQTLSEYQVNAGTYEINCWVKPCGFQ